MPPFQMPQPQYPSGHMQQAMGEHRIGPDFDKLVLRFQMLGHTQDNAIQMALQALKRYSDQHGGTFQIHRTK